MRKKLSEMTDEELEADIARFERMRLRARMLILCALVLKIIVLVTLLCLYGCATPPHAPPVGIWEGGMRMPDDEACYIVIENDVTKLKPCK